MLMLIGRIVADMGDDPERSQTRLFGSKSDSLSIPIGRYLCHADIHIARPKHDSWFEDR